MEKVFKSVIKTLASEKGNGSIYAIDSDFFYFKRGEKVTKVSAEDVADMVAEICNKLRAK